MTFLQLIILMQHKNNAALIKIFPIDYVSPSYVALAHLLQTIHLKRLVTLLIISITSIMFPLFTKSARLQMETTFIFYSIANRIRAVLFN